jgi:tetratricopeptide (TPR) repeat protein
VTKDRAAGQARVTFGQPAKLDLGAYRAASLSRVLAVTPFPGENKVSAEIDMKPGARIRDFRLDNRVVVDVFEPGEAPASVAGADGEDEGDTARASETSADDDGGDAQPRSSDPDQMAETTPETGEQKSERRESESGTTATPTSASEASDQTSGETGGGAESTTSGSSGPGEPTQLVPQPGEGSDQGAPADGAMAPSISAPDASDTSGKTQQNVQQAAAVQPPSATPNQQSKTGVPRMTYTPERIAQGLAPKAGEIPRHIRPTQLDLAWVGASAAVFRRAGSLFLVAEGTPKASFAQRLVDAADGVNKVEQRMKDGLAVIRMHTDAEMGARLQRDGDLWKLNLRPRAALPAQPVAIRAKGGKVILESNRPGKGIQLEDPASGSQLDVVTLGIRGQGLQLEKRFQEFSLLPTTQGVVVLPLAEHVVTEVTDKGVVVRGKNQELAVSQTDLNRNAAGPVDALKGNRLLNLPEWRRSDTPFAASRQALQKKVTDAPAAKKPLARLELARFYFAHGLATETLGALRLYADNTERRKSDPQVQLMMGASHLLAGNWQKAGETLADPVLDGVQEALPWRAGQAMAAGNDEAALAAFERSKGLLTPYPPAVRKQLRIWAAETYLRTGNVPKAEQQLSKLRSMDLTTGEQAEVKYLTARQMLLSDQVDKAEDMWREVAKSEHAPSRARARFVMIERDLASDRITREEAIEKLERLRFAWRGDEFEAVLLRRLADLYLAQDKYRPALETLEQAASHLPGTPQAKQAAERMRDVFKRLFLNGEADALRPVKALALYEDFRELTPPGEDGNELIANLADRLVEVDLLTRAADLLEGQVRHRLSGQAKAAAGARLASVQMLNLAPEKAVEALNMSQSEDIPPDLRRKRRHLRARALLRAGKPDMALAPVAGDTSQEATRIRAKIQAEQGNWDKVAGNLAQLLPEPPAEDESLSKAERDRVMRQAVALSMAENSDGLRTLQRRYGDAMAKTQQAETFQMLTSDDTADPTNIDAQLEQVARARSFVDGFLNDLRQQASLDN